MNNPLKIVAFLVFVILIGCSSEFNQNDLDFGSTEPPVITSVADARTENAVSSGVLGDFYWIRGENLASVISIKYNGFEAGFNPVYVTETLIISRVPLEAPFLNVSNKVTVETKNGTSSFDFALLTITDFEEEVRDGKGVVVLNGGDFTNVDKVSFLSGDDDLEAEIVSVTAEQVVAVIPDGIIQAFIQVFSNGVVAQSTSFGFNYPIFTDEAIGWDIGGFSGTQELSSEVALGSVSIKRTSDPFGGLTFLPNDEGETLVFADYSTVSFQVFPANSETTLIAVAINDFDRQILVDLVPNEWNRIVIPLSNIYPPGTEPETISRIDFQEFAGANALFYLDQFGFIE